MNKVMLVLFSLFLSQTTLANTSSGSLSQDIQSTNIWNVLVGVGYQAAVGGMSDGNYLTSNAEPTTNNPIQLGLGIYENIPGQTLYGADITWTYHSSNVLPQNLGRHPYEIIAGPSVLHFWSTRDQGLYSKLSFGPSLFLELGTGSDWLGVGTTAQTGYSFIISNYRLLVGLDVHGSSTLFLERNVSRISAGLIANMMF